MGERLRANPRLAGCLLIPLSCLLLGLTAFQYRQDGSVMGPAMALAGLTGALGCTMVLLGRALWGLHFLAMIAGCGVGIWIMDCLQSGTRLPIWLASLFGT